MSIKMTSAISGFNHWTYILNLVAALDGSSVAVSSAESTAVAAISAFVSTANSGRVNKSGEKESEESRGMHGRF